MKAFILKTILFSSVFFILFLSLIISTDVFINSKANFKLDREVNYIVLGHSQPECAFNDSLVSNFKNLSDPGETYFYTYQKLKKIVQHNPQLNTVFIEFTNNQINKSSDDNIWSDKYLRLRYPVYEPFIDFSDQFFLATKNFKGFLKNVPISIKYKLITVKLNNYNYINKTGGYKYLVRNKTDSLLNVLGKKNDTLNNNDFTMSEYNIEYLSKIISYCKKHNLNVFLTRSPYHAKSPNRHNEINFQKLKNNKFNDVKFLDFKDFPLENSEYGDLDHLNYKGAKKFSTWFNFLLEDGLIEKDNNQEFIDEKIIQLLNKRDSL